MPWADVTRVLIPLSLCDLAAEHLIHACGGEEIMKRTVGGTKWWRDRSTQGYVHRFFRPLILGSGSHGRTSIEAEWVTAEKARESPRWYRGKGSTEASFDESSEEDEGAHPEMDDTPCLLYIHGGKARSPYAGFRNSH